MGQLSLSLLGTPEVRRDDRLLTFPTRKALALLVYLAVEGGTHSREKIATLFWPDKDSAQGRGVLRSTLLYLRQSLGDDSRLLTNRDLLQFDFDPDSTLDLHRLDSAAQATRQLPVTNFANLRPLLAQLVQAASLVRGDFLEGFSLSDAPEFDNWASLQREVWHRKATLVFDWLSQLQFEGGELANAIESIGRWLKHDPFNEAAYRRLMQLHFATGDRAAALQAYESCRAMLERELKAEPSPETESLTDHIRTRPPPTREVETTPEAAPPEAPLIGRANEHSALIAAYRAARRGQPQVFSLEGEPGIGKSRLAKEFVAWASAQGAVVLQGRAFEMGSQMPYQVVVDALRSVLSRGDASLAPLLLPSLSPMWLAELTRLLPELHNLYPDLPTPLVSTEVESRSRLFEAVARLGQTLARDAPFVLFVDDLHWADAASLDLLTYVAQRWAVTHVRALLLFTVRSEELTTLADWFAALGRDLPRIRLVLNLLTQEDTLALVQALAVGGWKLEVRGSNIQSLIPNLYADTGGHPLFIIETVKSLWEQGSVSGTPPGVRAVIHNRLSRLSANARTACSAAAILGGQFKFQPLCRVTGLSENDGLLALEELLARGLLRERGDRYLFAHDKIREVAYADLSEARRQVFHRRALEALELAASSEELARHALAANVPERAFHLLVQAGDEAMRLFAARNAIAHYEQARALPANFQSPTSTRSVQSLYLQLGRAYELVSEWQNAREVYEAMLKFAREANQPVSECASLNHLATVAAQGFFDMPGAMALLHKALKLAEQSGEKYWLAETEWGLAEMGLYTGNFTAPMLAHGQRALVLARELDNRELIARSLNALAYNKLMTFGWKETEEHAQEARVLYAVLGNRAMESDCLNQVALARIRGGQPRAAVAAAHEAYAISLDIENTWGQANSLKEVAGGLLECGEYGEALKAAQAGVEMARATGHSWVLMPNLITLGDIYRALYALEMARTIHLEVKAMSDPIGHPYITELVATTLCADCALAGDWAEAHRYALLALSVRSENRAYAGFTRWLETEALLHGGDTDRAVADARFFGKQIEGVGAAPRQHLQYLRALAVLAQRRSETQQANVHLREAASIAESLGLPGELWPLYAALGEKQKAAEIVGSLAAKIDDERLRSAFLSAEPVRWAMAS